MANSWQYGTGMLHKVELEQRIPKNMVVYSVRQDELSIISTVTAHFKRWEPETFYKVPDTYIRGYGQQTDFIRFLL